MKSKLEIAPIYPANGRLRMYNMFPYRRYADGSIGIEDMSCYIHEVADMGYNAIWINPLQATGTKKQNHPDPEKHTEVSGSLYAMADDNAFNPLIFPNSPTRADCEQQLKNWTREVRRNNIFPLFDLVLNHIAINEGQDSPLNIKLTEAGKKHNLRLLLPEINERWPDIQGIDYYQNSSKKRGLTTEPKYLDAAKIDLVFKTLWEPMIRRYIVDYGFMGIRADALTHVPVPVQQRAYRLVQKLVKETYGTDAIIVGEFMAAQPEEYISALGACGLTHCLNPFSFYWGFNREGGYCNTSNESAFIKQNTQLAEIVLSSSKNIRSLVNLVITVNDLNESEKLQKNTIYIFQREKTWYFALNSNATDVCFSTAVVQPINVLENPQLQKLLDAVKLTNGKVDRANKKQIIELLYQSDKLQNLYAKSCTKTVSGGLIGVIGNHDVGTLKAKVMLDIAYSRSLINAIGDKKEQMETVYKNFKNRIKGALDLESLLIDLCNAFYLSPMDATQIRHELAMRIREKIFIQSMMCTGGWYSIAGDEFALCHKPLVFSEFGNDDVSIGTSLDAIRKKPESQEHDFRRFIRAINNLLEELPAASCNDKLSMHSVVLEDEISGEKPAELLFTVLRYSAITNQHYLICHSQEHMGLLCLTEKIAGILGPVPNCRVVVISADGALLEAVWSKGELELFLEDDQTVVGSLKQFGLFGGFKNSMVDVSILSPIEQYRC